MGTQKETPGEARRSMTDDERIAEIEEYHRRYFPVPNVSSHVEDLLRIIRDQRAGLAQARQAITNMRRVVDGA